MKTFVLDVSTGKLTVSDGGGAHVSEVASTTVATHSQPPDSSNPAQIYAIFM